MCEGQEIVEICGEYHVTIYHTANTCHFILLWSARFSEFNIWIPQYYPTELAGSRDHAIHCFADRLW